MNYIKNKIAQNLVPLPCSKINGKKCNNHKKILLLSSFMAAFIVGLAQPQFTNTHCFEVGDTSRLGFAIVTQTFDDYKALTGTNYTWDFNSGQTLVYGLAGHLLLLNINFRPPHKVYTPYFKVHK